MKLLEVIAFFLIITGSLTLLVFFSNAHAQEVPVETVQITQDQKLDIILSNLEKQNARIDKLEDGDKTVPKEKDFDIFEWIEEILIIIGSIVLAIIKYSDNKKSGDYRNAREQKELEKESKEKEFDKNLRLMKEKVEQSDFNNGKSQKKSQEITETYENTKKISERLLKLEGIIIGQSARQPQQYQPQPLTKMPEGETYTPSVQSPQTPQYPNQINQ